MGFGCWVCRVDEPPGRIETKFDLRSALCETRDLSTPLRDVDGYSRSATSSRTVAPASFFLMAAWNLRRSLLVPRKRGGVVRVHAATSLAHGITRIPVIADIWLSVCAARAGYWLTRPLSPENLRRGLLGVRSFFRAMLVSALINAALAAFSGAEVRWIPIFDGEDSSTEAAASESVDTPAADDAEGMSAALEEKLEGLLVATLSSCSDHTSDRCTEALFRAGSPTGGFKSMPNGFVEAEIGRSCRKANFARLEFEAGYRGKDSKESAVAMFVRARSGKWALLALDKAASLSAPFECDDPPYQDPKGARSALRSGAADWVVIDGKHEVDLSPLQLYGCAVDKIELVFEELSLSGGVDLGCWVEDGFSFSKKASLVAVPSPTPSTVSVRVTFSDGSETSWSLSSPDANGAESSSTENPKPASPPRPEASRFPMNRALVMGDWGGVFLDGALQCEAPCEIKVPVGDGVLHEIRLRKEGEADRVMTWRPKSVAEPLPSFPL